MTEELKPCPICGSSVHIEDLNGMNLVFEVVCGCCGMQWGCGTKEEVAAEWNRRVYE